MRRAFWNKYTMGCDEHYVLHVLRGAKDFIPELDLVALQGDRIVGQIAYTRSRVRTTEGKVLECATFGPVSVDPTLQGQGIGGHLIKESMRMAREMGFKAVIIYGDQAYYSRFGFQPSIKFKVTNEEGKYPFALLACELEQGALRGIRGKVELSPAFQIDEHKAAAFDEQFEFLEKRETQSQIDFLEMASKAYENSAE